MSNDEQLDFFGYEDDRQLSDENEQVIYFTVSDFEHLITQFGIEIVMQHLKDSTKLKLKEYLNGN